MSEEEANVNMEKRCPQCGAELPGGGLGGLCPACMLKQAAADTATQPEIHGFEPPTVAELAALFPQLEILSLIGRGGMGAVYKARQPLLDRLVAVKILPAQVTRGTDFAERFTREARALARLHHPNIVMVYDFGQMNGQPYFVMEYVDGLNLRQLEQAGKLTPAEALQIVPQICEALQFAHDAGIVHRDIKPDNILLDKKGRVKIADFGIAKIIGAGADPSVPVTQGAIGTPHYMAPEQVERPQSVDHRADIFSLGVVFYEMLTGELPLGKFGPPSSGPKGLRVDVRLDEVVFRALEREPDRRYQHASQVKTAVETIAGSLPSGSFPPGYLAAGSGTPASGLAPEAVLARDYQLGIRRCLSRAWALVQSDFWPLVGMTALILALISVATSTFVTMGDSSKGTFQGFSALALLLDGPLLGGLYLYFLKKIRREPASVEIAFSGFGKRFLHLFLANFVVIALTVLGFLCFVLPGIYLLVAWIFTLILVIDQGMDFWPAMELSRKMVQRHWWKVLLLLAAFLALVLMGLMACFIGVFLTAPIAIATLAYAYEDIFGPRAPAIRPLAAPPIAPAPAAAFGPAGTLVVPNVPAPPAAAAGGAGTPPAAGGASPPKTPPPPAPASPPGGIPPRRPVTPRASSGFAKWIFVFGLIALLGLLFLIAMVALLPSFRVPVGDRVATHKFGNASIRIGDDEQSAAAEPIPPIPPMAPLAPLESPPAVSVRNPATQALADRLQQELARVSLAFDDFAVAATNGTNLVVTFTGLQKLAAAGTSSGSAGLVVNNGNEVVSVSPSHGIQIVDKSDHDHTAVSIGGLHISINENQTSSGQEENGSLVGSPVEAGQWKFDGNGQLAAVSFVMPALDWAAVLAASAPSAAAAGEKNAANSREILSERLEAAQTISEETVKDKALAAVAEDAAKSGDLETLNAALQQVADGDARDAMALKDVNLLAQAGYRKAALEIARTITDNDLRDEALSKLAQ